jgi:type I restriction enzyme S subunit
MFESWSVPAFEFDVPEYVTGEEVGSNKQKVYPGDVLLCKINPRINRVWLVRDKGDFDQIASTEWIVLRSRALYPPFLLYQLRAEDFRQRFLVDLSGIGGSLTRARPRIVGGLKARLAPSNEQKRIVTRIEELQARSRRASEALETIPDLIDQLRQSILSSAFRGDLTKEWREKQTNIEPAKVLLNRIRAERRKRWEEAELEKLRERGLSEEKFKEAFANRRKQYKEPFSANTDNLPELPKQWCWASIDELSSLVTKGSSPNWQGFNYVSAGIPFVRSQNVLSRELNLSDLAFLPKSFNTKERRSILMTDDVLINIVGASIGRTALANEKVHGGNVNQAVAVIRLIPGGMLPPLLVDFLLSPRGQDQIHGGKVDVARANLSLTDISTIVIPLPPAVEQTELNTHLNKNMTVLSHLKDVLAELKVLHTDLDQAILSKAFRGGLVPQNPNDEPASILLERIRQEKALAMAEPKAKDKRKGKIMKHKQEEQRDIFSVLRKSGQAMTPEEVFSKVGFDEAEVDTFYEQLRQAIAAKQIREIRKGKTIRLEAIAS